MPTWHCETCNQTVTAEANQNGIAYCPSCVLRAMSAASGEPGMLLLPNTGVRIDPSALVRGGQLSAVSMGCSIGVPMSGRLETPPYLGQWTRSPMYQAQVPSLMSDQGVPNPSFVREWAAVFDPGPDPEAFTATHVSEPGIAITVESIEAAMQSVAPRANIARSIHEPETPLNGPPAVTQGSDTFAAESAERQPLTAGQVDAALRAVLLESEPLTEGRRALAAAMTAPLRRYMESASDSQDALQRYFTENTIRGFDGPDSYTYTGSPMPHIRHQVNIDPFQFKPEGLDKAEEPLPGRQWLSCLDLAEEL